MVIKHSPTFLFILSVAEFLSTQLMKICSNAVTGLDVSIPEFTELWESTMGTSRRGSQAPTDEESKMQVFTFIQSWPSRCGVFSMLLILLWHLLL